MSCPYPGPYLFSAWILGMWFWKPKPTNKQEKHICTHPFKWCHWCPRIYRVYIPPGIWNLCCSGPGCLCVRLPSSRIAQTHAPLCPGTASNTSLNNLELFQFEQSWDYFPSHIFCLTSTPSFKTHVNLIKKKKRNNHRKIFQRVICFLHCNENMHDTVTEGPSQRGWDKGIYPRTRGGGLPQILSNSFPWPQWYRRVESFQGWPDSCWEVALVEGLFAECQRLQWPLYSIVVLAESLW